MAVRLQCVLTVFDDIQIKGTQIINAEVMQSLGDLREFITVIMDHNFSGQFAGSSDHFCVERYQIIHWNLIGLVIKSSHVCQQESGSIPDTSIRV